MLAVAGTKGCHASRSPLEDFVTCPLLRVVGHMSSWRRHMMLVVTIQSVTLLDDGRDQ